MENLVINSFYFMSGLVLLEKAEGTMEAQIITPLRDREYLLSKVIALGVLSLIESLVIIVIVSGVGFNWLLMVLGILLLMTIYVFYGFIVVARYDSINEFLLPSVIWTLGYSLPLLYYFGLWKNWLMFLHPIQAPLVLMQAAFEPLPVWQILYGVFYAAMWAGIAYFLSRRAFYRFVVRKEGTK
jgi:fluoroquinolone transport system permease protein